MSLKTKFWNPNRQYLAHKSEFDKEMQRVLEAGDLILRQDGELFEQNLAQFLGVKHVVAVASGTDALILSLKACNIGFGDEVLVSSYTFRATVEAVKHAGAKPVLYDKDYELFVSHKTKAIIPCHLEGKVWDDMDKLTSFANKNGLAVIEDAAQSIGTPVKGTTACYSFYPAKILGCFGDGGAIATNNTVLAEYLRKMRNHFKDDWAIGYGYNSRLDNLQAAVLNIKMKYLKENLARRKQVAERYTKELKGVGVPEPRDIYQDFVITSFNRDALHKFLKEQGVETLKNEYPFPGDLQKDLSIQLYESFSLRIPCNPEMTNEEVSAVINAINSYERP